LPYCRVLLILCGKAEGRGQRAEGEDFFACGKGGSEERKKNFLLPSAFCPLPS